MAKKTKLTPLMQQYNAIKAKYPEALLLFRVGDFYETFGSDAVKAAEVLNIMLTKRNNGAAGHIELAGFPHHALDTYLPKLVRAGLRVAVCDQLEDPKQAKGVVKRGVTDIVTPGIALDENILEQTQANYLAAVHQPAKGEFAAAFLELSTGEFFVLSGGWPRMEKMLYSLRPAEVIVPRGEQRAQADRLRGDFYLHALDDWVFERAYAHDQLLRHYKVSSLKGFGLEDEDGAAMAAGVLLHYLRENEQKRLGHIRQLQRFADERYLGLDKFTVRNLELLAPMHPDGTSLFAVLNRARTPMGARRLRRWLSFPLRDKAAIDKRRARVKAFYENEALRQSFAELLKEVGDLERLVSKLSTKKINPRELQRLRAGLLALGPIQELLTKGAPEAFKELPSQLQDVSAATALLQAQLMDEPSSQVGSGAVIKEGVSAELDEIRGLKEDGEGYLEAMRQREAARTGISSLRIKFNKVFGYYIEVTNTHRDKVPEDYIRKQTLTNAERYITEELKGYEEKILSAEERMAGLELALYDQLLEGLQGHLTAIQTNALQLATLDVQQGLAEVARSNQYNEPELLEDGSIDIVQGRHPVIETLLPRDRPYIPNDILLDGQEQQVALITGPNMAGKSALLRQTALIVLLAQMGSYVPAREARIGLVDKIFTRVGASDNVSAGESTFMVEMLETAAIVNNATPDSLILLDEIGRGTSTYDGVSIAWALVEHLHNTPTCRAKTLFATHYHELAYLADKLPRVVNFNVSVKEVEGKIIFLRTLKPGASEHSFGIQVAEMAGLPSGLIERAKGLLRFFEAHAPKQGAEQTTEEDSQAQPKLLHTPEAAAATHQLRLFTVADDASNRIRQMLQGLDVNNLTPVEALLKLQEIQQALDAE